MATDKKKIIQSIVTNYDITPDRVEDMLDEQDLAFIEKVTVNSYTSTVWAADTIAESHNLQPKEIQEPGTL